MILTMSREGLRLDPVPRALTSKGHMLSSGRQDDTPWRPFSLDNPQKEQNPCFSSPQFSHRRLAQSAA